MTEERTAEKAMPFGAELNISTILRDIRKRLYVILCVSISLGLLATVYFAQRYTPTYTAQMAYVVTKTGTNNNVYENLSTTSSVAYTVSQIATSAEFRAILAEELGGVVRGSISAEYVDTTNIVVMSVRSSTPMDAYRVIRGVMNNNQVFLDYLSKDVRLSVLVSPTVPTEPDSHYGDGLKGLYVFLGVFAVLVFLEAFLSWRKETVKTGAEVETLLGTPLLGSICHEEKFKSFRARMRGKQRSMLITRPTVSFPYTEGYHKLARKVMNRMKAKEAKTLLVTSVNENEGKSTVAANLALAMVAGGKKVLLLDLDMRKPSLYKLFDIEDGAEIDNLGALLNKKPMDGNLVQLLSRENLYVIFNTRSYPQSAEMLSNGRLPELLRYLREQFDYIVIDTPPMNVVADAEVIADCADASLVVVREHQSLVQAIRSALDILRDSRTNHLIGCVMNDVHGGVGRGIGGYQYGYDYGYRYDRGYGKYYGRYDRT